MKTLAIFNNKGGVGKTSLVYHVARMLALRGHRVVAIDLDPQANLSGMCLADDAIEMLWDSGGSATVYSAMQPLIEGTGDILPVQPQQVAERFWLLPGDLSLSETEDGLSTVWPSCLGGEKRAFRLTSAFDRMLRAAAVSKRAEVCLIDVGPNLGAINRSAMIAADCVLIPIGADLFSMRGLRNVGTKLTEWRNAWRDRFDRAPQRLGFTLPPGDMLPIGYVVSRYSTRARGPAKAFKRWLDRAPIVYAESVLGSQAIVEGLDDDSHRLALLKDYRSLMAMAQEVRKPMFALKPADGAIGGHQRAVQDCFDDFAALAEKLETRLGLSAN